MYIMLTAFYLKNLDQTYIRVPRALSTVHIDSITKQQFFQKTVFYNFSKMLVEFVLFYSREQ